MFRSGNSVPHFHIQTYLPKSACWPMTRHRGPNTKVLSRVFLLAFLPRSFASFSPLQSNPAFLTTFSRIDYFHGHRPAHSSHDSRATHGKGNGILNIYLRIDPFFPLRTATFPPFLGGFRGSNSVTAFHVS